MNTRLEKLSEMLSGAAEPEQIFGFLNSKNMKQDLKNCYFQLVKIAHPDRYFTNHEKEMAEKTMIRLNFFYQLALNKVSEGRYGQSDTEEIEIRTENYTYSCIPNPVPVPIYRRFDASAKKENERISVELKLPEDARNNDLIENEIASLNHLTSSAESSRFTAYFPRILEDFFLEENGWHYHAVASIKQTGCYTLADVHKRYPDGIDPRDMAWMFRRLLAALGFIHRQGLTHGAILPSNILLIPEDHGLVLTGWLTGVNASVSNLKRARILFPAFASWYSGDFDRIQNITPAVDIIHAARTILYLLGAEITPARNHCLPEGLKNFFHGLILPVNRVPTDAWQLLQEFDDLISFYWGERKFRPFKM